MPDLWLSEATMTSDASSRALSTLPRTTTTFLHSSTSNATSFPILAATTRLHVQHGHALLSDVQRFPVRLQTHVIAGLNFLEPRLVSN
ncbi:hypothetical protein PC116_g25748 [Phytophthora cactorum]|uniref:Uncharacterized protein n=1 Tax=Phytophthora cactorum TaxID=29920 RepID=A0A8T1B2L1_9STRA|nr:hypothetical protein Pcac1_g8004 [Phytophthora cactorum]KAG2876992.1 hypothetical protein PC114_g23896 [Phytophthora cactorum]KAG2893384.1 hypothetical protein PC117_g23776 [Phytophthora cactorum]KAG2971332.1 hypothetical protein PC119_g23417 [Phytophthora cactorum]KAG3129329.1 hypothetical protein C6341_g24164 [Phytophthora cactorum]